MIFKKYFLIALALFLFSEESISQDEKSNEIIKPLAMVHVFSGTANVAFGVAKAQFTKGTSEWKHPFGYSITGGVGVSYMMKNNIGLEADFSYELNSYLFNNKNVNLSLGYRAPYADVKIKKIFKPDAEDSFYAKAGAGYMFGGAGGVGKSDTLYTYSINFENRSILLVVGEIGFQKRSSKTNYQDFGVVFRYGLSNIISSDMNYHNGVGTLDDEIASSVTAGSYIGITYKYYVVFKEMSKKHKQTRRAPDEQF